MSRLGSERGSTLDDVAATTLGVGRSDGIRRLPAPPLRPYIRWYEGYRLEGFPAGTHLGLPSPDLTVVLTLGAPVDIASAAAPGQAPGRFTTLASGLATAAVEIAHDGNQHGIQLAVTPAGARALFDVPTAALGAWIVELDDVLTDTDRLLDGITAASTWQGRFDVLDRILVRRLAAAHTTVVDRSLDRAWSLLVHGRGTAVRDVASDVGWSRRRLTSRFTAEFGVAPKDASRIARFDRSRLLLAGAPGRRLADVAVAAGYYDQAHLAREWRALAGVPPSRWLADEVFPFVQDTAVRSDDAGRHDRQDHDREDTGGR